MNYNNILVVDDSSTARMIIKRCFDIAGFSSSNYFYAENGIDALTMIEKEKIDLIITDLNMPKMDGNNFIKKMRSENNNIPIIVISSVVNTLIEEEFKEFEILGIIKKPVSPAKILEIVGEYEC
ncbi:MAG: hypothetical protein A2086_05890 [Spirochaetes bacterium GWD1_27_9]|nr:MAG: hypothetical protein A2Z98_17700 [Spirochaetes bacterium GWB1_27_13]OHD26691.1 MAG: hypothetical protein A2Y34_01780 [Spirochaetes bacterium GWC1_27_15]OHD35531.1 MAG: hypothetical protein A2086_05890 [Spirochaetes bacterium GWD1_27_9]